MTRHLRQKLIRAGIIQPHRHPPAPPEPERDPRKGGRPRLPAGDERTEMRRARARRYHLRKKLAAA